MSYDAAAPNFHAEITLGFFAANNGAQNRCATWERYRVVAKET